MAYTRAYSRSSRTGGRHFTIALTCGCSLLLRNPPISRQVELGCPSGLGHGYRLTWLSWTNTLTGAHSANS
ncbi:hypothetical protein F4556_005205 [Kitasatospora gansuensis]|uniref:Uncharacterized protein n=1 Tax=Kitasatospora gansuensis TaxID=258050 RepID=A0A7W7SFS4_9ACTN|nr:hypothetical protein [Kitasatospora gansuensis]MBB4949670.1 hypothetical protein [Kitasatospora gansuensis]